MIYQLAGIFVRKKIDKVLKLALNGNFHRKILCFAAKGNQRPYTMTVRQDDQSACRTSSERLMHNHSI